MKLSKQYTTVTPLSKLIALILFILLPIIAFFLGMDFQKKIQESLNLPMQEVNLEETSVDLPYTEVKPY